jgi:hypothetical protein
VPPPPLPPDASDQALGRRLAERLAQLETTSPQRIRGLLPELLGQGSPLQAPLHDLVGRAGFGRLIAAAGQQPRSGVREQLLQELAETYSTRMTVRLGAVLDGLLEPRAADRASPLPLSPRRQASAPGKAGPSPGGLLGLVALTAAIALGSGLVFAILRSNALCPRLGLCLPTAGSAAAEASVEAGLSRAERAAGLVRGATNLADFATGLEQLDSTLLELVSRRLNPRQEQKRQRLQEDADVAHRRLREERRAQRSLEEAAALIGGLEASRAAGPERLDALAEVQARLDEIAGDSFARASVEPLERRLTAIRERPPEPEPDPHNLEAPAAPPLPRPASEPSPASSPQPSAWRPERAPVPSAPPAEPLPPPPVLAPGAPSPLPTPSAPPPVPTPP